MCSTSESVVTVVGVGIDTARYGHHVTLLDDKRQMVAQPFEFLESRGGYEELKKAFAQLADKHPNVHFQIRVDAASQYAANLVAFLHTLPWSKTVSIGDPLRNRRYREVHFPKRKSDTVDSHACSRFAVVERPKPTAAPTEEARALREVSSRLEFQVKQTTREINRLHDLAARTFPELATLQNDLKALWVLRLLKQYPTAERIGKARLSSLVKIPYVTEQKARQIQEAARRSVASASGEVVEQLVRQSVGGLLASIQAEKELETLLWQAFEALPDERAKKVATIAGIGKRTAAILVAKIGSIDRFPTASHLTGYFGVFPEERSSGVDKSGRPTAPRPMRMSRKGNDLVRKCLWMSALVALRHNPHVRDLYTRLRARGRRGDVAMGHCMRKLLHQVFGIWNSGQPYDPNYRRPEKSVACDNAKSRTAEQEKAAGRTTEISPKRKAVTATASTLNNSQQNVNESHQDFSPTVDHSGHGGVDYAYLRSQITLQRVLRHLGYFDRLRGGGPQRRGPCPVHGAKRSRGRTFSVHLDKNVYQCFHPSCGISGNVLDLWCQVHNLTIYEGAIQLAETFGLELHPDQRRGTRQPNP